jgi:hypothetical protein
MKVGGCVVVWYGGFPHRCAGGTGGRGIIRDMKDAVYRDYRLFSDMNFPLHWRHAVPLPWAGDC